MKNPVDVPALSGLHRITAEYSLSSGTVASSDLTTDRRSSKATFSMTAEKASNCVD